MNHVKLGPVFDLGARPAPLTVGRIVFGPQVAGQIIAEAATDRARKAAKALRIRDAQRARDALPR